MSHLTLETIARLVDDEPAAAESAHLESCAVCRAELDAMRDDVHALSLLPDMAPAPDSWDALEQRLAEEGLVRHRRFAGIGSRQLGWAAAAMVVFMAGSLAGRVTAPDGQQVAQAPAPPAPSATAPEHASGAQPRAEPALRETHPAGPESVEPAPRGAPAYASAGDEPSLERAALPQPRRGSPMTLASNPGAPALPRNMDEAALLLRQTEELYLAALTRYAELATQAESGDPVSRLAALQSIVMTTQAALTQAPADPVINGYHLTALAQRDATLRQVAASTGDRLY
jgi:hypothetical protein